MAANSKREQITGKVVSLLTGLASISTVKRVQPTGLSALQSYASTQLPLAVVLAGLPVPKEKYSQQARNLDTVISDLGIDIFVYAMDNVNPDSTISTLVDDIWALLYADITQGFNWVHSTRLMPEPATGIWDPYCGFNIRAIITYQHSKGGI